MPSFYMRRYLFTDLLIGWLTDLLIDWLIDLISIYIYSIYLALRIKGTLLTFGNKTSFSRRVTITSNLWFK